MRVTLDENGMMIVRASNELEAYALKQWMDQNLGTKPGFLNTKNIQFDATLETEKSRLIPAMPKEIERSKVMIDDFSRLQIMPLNSTEKAAFESWADNAGVKSKDIRIG